MRAGRPDGEDLRPAAHKQHLLIAAMADKLCAIGKIGQRDPLDQIRPVRFVMAFRHFLLLWRSGVEIAYTDEKRELRPASL
ncbi:hypothetical protein, partial [Mesorhizobium sp. M7A.F.Ca.US.007.01.1.1]|uniref:hypothetical protein n=1 Tax=Mesorhizobium sp. M7A.F.Ca.US.007.01.1.1 TaxID=2496712 RepID=UPI0013E2D0B0